MEKRGSGESIILIARDREYKLLHTGLTVESILHEQPAIRGTCLHKIRMRYEGVSAGSTQS
jgi:hypothetical protein